MRDLKSGAENPKSLGYAFVAFEEHKDALKTLQVLNNNNSILGGNRVSLCSLSLYVNLKLCSSAQVPHQKVYFLAQRPIVEFSLENSRALEKKRRRIEKSQVSFL